MANLTREDVLKLARLARIDLSDAEVEAFAADCSEILRYVEQLQNVDVDNLQPTSQVSGLTNVMRDDAVESYGYAPEALLRDVAVEAGQIKVKRMIER